MNNVQLYLAIGIPALLNGLNLGVMLFFLGVINSRIARVEERIDHLIGAVNDLDKRLTRVETKLGITPV